MYSNQRVCFFSLCWLAALLAPRTYVPPAWWQGGWRRRPVSHLKEVELLSHLAAALMPETPICELFRSFPSPDGDNDLEPSLTAYGILKDPHAALFVNCDFKGNGIGSKLEKALLAYGPLGSHIIYISHCENKPLEDKVLHVKVRDWQADNKTSLLEALTDLRVQVLLGLGKVLCPEGLRQVEFLLRPDTEDHKNQFHVLMSETARREIKHFLSEQGFRQASIQRMQKSALLCGKCAEAKLQSRIHWLLKVDRRPSEVAAAIEACLPVLGSSLYPNLNVTQQRLLDFGLPWNQASKAPRTFPSVLSSSAEPNLMPIVKWLLDLGLSSRQVVRATRCCPEVLGFSVEWISKNVKSFVDLGLERLQVAKIIAKCPDILSTDVRNMARWLLDFGLTKRQSAKMISSYPEMFTLKMEQSLKPKVRWLVGLGMTQKQVAKAITSSPHILGLTIQGNLKPKVQWFLDTGLRLNQIAKTIAKFPKVLLFDVETSLQPKGSWLLELGLTQDQIVKVFAGCPEFLALSIEQNLKPKVEWFVDCGLNKRQMAKVISNFPGVFTLSIEYNLKLKMDWLLQLGLTQDQVVQAVADFPQITALSVQQNLQPKVEWLVELGLTQDQIVKAVVCFPHIFGLSIEQNLRCKVRWLGEFGLQKDQVLKIISSFPLVFKYSIENNLMHKQNLLQRVFGAAGAVEIVLKQPVILSMSYERLSTRLKVLVARNETVKLPSAVLLAEDQFHARYREKSTNYTL